MVYSADFETTTDANDCRVWAWCVCEVEHPDNIQYGTSMDTFIQFCKENNGVYFFHNAAFDCEFILHYLLTNGFIYSEKPASNSFNTLISSMGKFYEMTIYFTCEGKKKRNKVVIKDSLKKLPMKVSDIAKAFKLPISKLEIDYNEYREVGHELTPLEQEYIKNDVQIVAMALQVQFAQGLDRLTIGSDALHYYRGIVGKKWKELFPVLSIEMDTLIRKAYRGGWTYVAPQFQGKIVGAGSVYDVNSLYPDVMYNKPLPIGTPVYYKKRYTPDSSYPLYIQFLTCQCTLKKDHLPTLQIKHNPFYSEREYVIKTEGAVDLALTSVDMELLFEHYDVSVVSWNGGYKFKAMTGLFTEYIDYWMGIKKTTTGGKRKLAKLMLNSLYGKFATNPDVTPKVPYLKTDNTVGYKLGDSDTREPVYTPVACFITAWARYKTISTAQEVYPRFMYADTDSIHVLGQEPLNLSDMEVHPVNLGAWKHEANFIRAKYVRAKTYMERISQMGEVIEGSYTMVDVDPFDDVKCAGMPEELKAKVTFDNFKRGLALYGKLRPHHCEGGIVLESTTFTIT